VQNQLIHERRQSCQIALGVGTRPLPQPFTLAALEQWLGLRLSDRSARAAARPPRLPAPLSPAER
jgi:hypothetical protein